jgi:hypothetical protein
MRRVALVVILVLVGGLWPAVHVLASGATAVQATAAGSLQADFNNDGVEDLAVGVGEAVNGAQSAGAVSVLSGSAGGVTGTGSQLFTQVGDTPEAGDGFGGVLAAGDFNHDGFADLAASAVGEDVGSVRNAGAVSVLYGSATGLTSSGGQLFTQVGGAAELEDRFGLALAAGDFNHDGAADLAAGAPGESFDIAGEAGAVSVLYGSVTGLSRTGGQLFTQNSAGVPDYAEAGDGFGGALAAG